MSPFFSIIIPTYNRAHLVSKAIDSVISQTFEDWELIVVDDGSTDNTKERINFYQENDSRIRYIYQENAERSAARNKGIDHAQGEYICFLDSDDYYLENRLKGLFDYIQSEKEPKSFYYTAITYDYHGRLVERPERKRGNENVYEFIVQAIIGTPQVMVSKKILSKECFDPKWRIGEDMELWLRLARIEEPIFIKNQANVVAIEHDDRSVNERKYNSGLEQYKLYKHIFRKSHSGSLLSKEIKRRLNSNAYFSIFRFWFYNSNHLKAIFNLAKSIWTMPFHEQTKYRVNLLIKLMSGSNFSKIESIL